MTSKQKKDKLRWLYSCDTLTVDMHYQKQELATWYRTEYKKYLNEFGQVVAEILLA